MNWNNAFKNKRFKVEFFITFILLALVLFTLASFLNFIETRNGVRLDDPLLKLFEPVDLTWLTFGLIYISLIASIIIFSKKPDLLLLAIQSYIIMIIFRITAMYLIPLDPPEKMIPLVDPFVEFFGTGQLLTKDLFFSGHTATLFLLFLLMGDKILKKILIICTFIIAISVLLQHVHYAIDIFAVPFFAYISFVLTKKMRRKYSSLAI